jgi:hypothetical protein
MFAGRFTVAATFAGVLIVVLPAGFAAAGCGGFREGPSDAGADVVTTDGAVDGPAPDAGDSFTIVHDAPDGGALRAVWGSGADDVFAVGEDGAAFEWTGGQTLETHLGDGMNMYGVWGTGPQDVFAVGAVADRDAAVIMHKSSVGWIEITTSYPHAMRGVWGAGTQVFAVGYDGVILSGRSFAAGMQASPNPDIPQTTYGPMLYAVSGTSPDNVMVAADVDTTLYYDGTQWHEYADPTDRTRTYRSVFGAPGAGMDFYWGANYYGLWHFTGKANPVLQLNEERDQPQNFSRYIWGIWGPTNDRVVCVGDGGRIMTFDSINGIRILDSPTGRNLYGVWGTSFDDLWIVGEGQIVLHGSVRF